MAPNTLTKVRFPPSPTGPMHIGTARAMLFNYLFAKKMGGTIVFRSEDTDQARSTTEYEQEIIDGLTWLGLTWDEGPYRQSERYSVYERHFETLKKSGAIYPCYCTAAELEAERAEQNTKKLPPGYSGRCRDLTAPQIQQFEAEGRQPAFRFRVPHEAIHFTDLIRGEITEQGRGIADFVVRKADGQFLYHFCVVVDDMEMGVTHVIRGEDHISNTPKHLLLFRALSATIPTFAHLPLLLNKDRSKMSKRDESGRPMTLTRLREDGYLPAAVVNYLALLGWNPGDTREFFTLSELTQEFDLARVAKAGAIFDLERLNFFNQHYIRELPMEELSASIRPLLDFPVTDEQKLTQAISLIRERLKFFSEAPAQLKFFFVTPDVQNELYPNEKMKVDLAMARQALIAALPAFEQIDETQWTRATLEAALLALVVQLGWKNGQLLWPLRVALTGEKFSPGTFEVAEIIGKTEVLTRLNRAIDKIK